MNKPTLTFLMELALRAGDVLRVGYGTHLDISRKGPTDLVTNIDRQSEALIVKALQTEFPDHGIYTEEQGQLNEGAEIHWYIDPLDGTVNYAHGLPIFSVSIAYSECGEPLLGVVYNPMDQMLFAAEKHKGSRLNGRPIHCTQTDALIDALLITGFPYDMQQANNNLAQFNALAMASQGVRRLGSAALDLCYVAAGLADGYWEYDLKPYDVAAGILIAREAGAVVTAPDGRKAGLLTPPCNVLCANSELHRELQTALEKVK